MPDPKTENRHQELVWPDRWMEPPARVGKQIQLGTGLAEGYRQFDSPLGSVWVGFNPKGVTWLQLVVAEVPLSPDSKPQPKPRLPALPPDGWSALIETAISRGQPGELPVDLSQLSSFGRSVLTTTAHIPPGQVRSYRWIAQEIGSPQAVRAVGTALARNPLPLIIPCHRVVRSDGSFGQYSLGGKENKRILLEQEARII